MPTDNDFWIITLGLMVTITGVACSIVVLWYMMKYSVASTTYLRTHDATAWRKTVRKAAGKAAVAVGILMFISIESCAALVFLEFLDITLARLMPWIAFGVLASLLAGGYILLHARWQDLMNKAIDWYRRRRRYQDSRERPNQ